MKTRHVTIRVLGLTFLTASLTGSPAQNGGPTTSAPTPAAPPAKSSVPRLSPWAGEIVKLARAGVEDSVVLSFIENSGTFNLGADQIIRLANAGVSTPVITAMLQHDADLASGVKPLTVSSQPKMDAEVEKALARLREADEKAAASIRTPSASGASENIKSAVAQSSEPAPEAQPAVPGEDPAKSQPTVVGTSEPPKPAVAPLQPSVPQKTASPYRVREPYPVELVPPFFVINAASRTPNLVVIDMFPSSR